MYRKYINAYLVESCSPILVCLFDDRRLVMCSFLITLIFISHSNPHSLVSPPVPVVLYNSVAGSLLCQVMYSLLLLPLGTVQPLLSHLLALLEHLNDFNRLLPETVLLEEQELGVEAQKSCSGQFSGPGIVINQLLKLWQKM